MADWHYGDGHGGPSLTKNDWAGPIGDVAALEAITTNIGDILPGIADSTEKLSFPHVTTVPESAFHALDSLTELHIPKAETIGDWSLGDLIYNPNFKIWLPEKFNNDADKNRIFGTSDLSSITVNWIGSTGGGTTPTNINQIIFGNKIQDTQYDWNGKTVAKFIYNGKECVLKVPGGNK